MESDLRSKVSLSSYESVIENISILKKELHNMIVTLIRSVVGSIQGLRDDQVYIKFKSTLMKLHISLRPKESSWPIIFLDVFMPHLVNWPTHLRLQKILHVEDLFKKFESDLSRNEFYIKSSNRKSECAKDDNESSNSIDNNNVSCDY